MRTLIIRLFTFAAALFGLSCTRCPESEYGDLLQKVPSPETKNDGVDLAGWTYEHLVSKPSNETHYFYRYAADDPNKPTFVFLHGLLFDGKNFLKFKPLAKEFNLIAYDLPNESKFYRGGADDFPELLTDFLQTLNLKQIYLGGVSLGGQIAMTYAAKPRPVPLLGLLLISTEIPTNDKELRSAVRLVKTTERITDRESGKTLCMVTKLVNKKQADAKGKLDALDHFVLRKVDFYNQVLDSTLSRTAPVDLKSIQIPTLIIHGDMDTVVPIKDASKLADCIPNAKFYMIKGGEHTIAYVRADEIMKLIEDRFVVATPPSNTASKAQ